MWLEPTGQPSRYLETMTGSKAEEPAKPHMPLLIPTSFENIDVAVSGQEEWGTCDI